MVGEQDDGLESENFDFEDDNEIEVAKVKIGNKCVVVANELERTGIHFLWFSTTSHYTGAWKHLVMVGGTFGTRVTYFWGDYGIREQHDQCSKPFLHIA
jgi:hypothetical protein